MPPASDTHEKDNIDFVTEIMTFSQYGALAQLFVIEAIFEYSQVVSDLDPDDFVPDSSIDPHSWTGVASEIRKKLEARLAKPTPVGDRGTATVSDVDVGDDVAEQSELPPGGATHDPSL